MTFEEFFQKKRINLTALQAGEPALFAEFKTHFEQMGEKSFDHTKKYWFNKLRLLYHLAPELKPEKIHIENQLAEQTIVETLTDTIPKPTIGFKPRFSVAAVKPKEQNVEPETQQATPNAETATEQPVAKPAGFKPRFNTKMVAPTDKVAETITAKDESEREIESAAAKPAGFTPRFNAKVMAPKPVAEELTAKEPVQPEIRKPGGEDNTEPVDAPAKPAGFKPRFNAKTTKPNPSQEQ